MLRGPRCTRTLRCSASTRLSDIGPLCHKPNDHPSIVHAHRHAYALRAAAVRHPAVRMEARVQRQTPAGRDEHGRGIAVAREAAFFLVEEHLTSIGCARSGSLWRSRPRTRPHRTIGSAHTHCVIPSEACLTVQLGILHSTPLSPSYPQR